MGVTRFPETLLLFRKDRKKEGMFPEYNIDAILCGAYVQYHKVMNTVALPL